MSKFLFCQSQLPAGSRKWQMAEKEKKVYYAAGWQPEPYIPREAAWADSSPHVRLSDYHVVRNDENAYSWQIQCGVSGKDYKAAWKGEEKEVVVSVEDGCLILKNPGEATGAYLKLPKKADPEGDIHVDTPPRGGFFVTIPKKGAKAAPEPLSQDILGTGPIIKQDRAPPLEDELAAITERQKEWLAKGRKIPGMVPGAA